MWKATDPKHGTPTNWRWKHCLVMLATMMIALPSVAVVEGIRPEVCALIQVNLLEPHLQGQPARKNDQPQAMEMARQYIDAAISIQKKLTIPNWQRRWHGERESPELLLGSETKNRLREVNAMAGIQIFTDACTAPSVSATTPIVARYSGRPQPTEGLP